MKGWNRLAGAMALTLGLTSFMPMASALEAPAERVTLTKIGGYSTGADLDEAGAEIVSYDPDTQKVYLINGANSSFEIVDLSVLESEKNTNLEAVKKVSIRNESPDIETNPETPLFGDVTSIAVHPEADLIAASVPNSEKTERGSVVFFNKNGDYLGHVTVGALPDMITVTETPDGIVRFLIANEGEPHDDDYIRNPDPEGSVSIIDLLAEAPEAGESGLEPGDSASIAAGDETFYPVVATAGFTGLDPERDIDDNVRYAPLMGEHNPNPTAEEWARDFEPEYIVVDEKAQKAYVALQESNAIGVLDLETKSFEHVYGLGFKNYMEDGNRLDPSKDNEEISISGPYPLLGVYMPDGIALKEIGGRTYLFTANEGDAREWGNGEWDEEDEEYKTDADEVSVADAYEDEDYVFDLKAEYYGYDDQAEFDAAIDEIAGGDRDGLFTDEDLLGGLNVMNSVSDAVYRVDGKTYVHALYTYGGRSFSIWNVDRFGSDDQLVFDSKDDFEQAAAAFVPELFNTDHSENAFDDRSDAKGPEPEYVEIGEIDGETYAFVGLERQSALMVYNVSNPANPVFESFVNMRDPSVNPLDEDDLGNGDLGPEGLKFVSADQSPTGKPLLLTGNEVSGTLAVYEISLTNQLAAFSVNAVEDADTYTVTKADGIATMTVNAGVSGWATFGASVSAVLGHDGSETVVFKHSRGSEQLGLSAIRSDVDAQPLEAAVQFNVRAGDTVTVYVVDELSNDPDQQPNVLQ